MAKGVQSAQKDKKRVWSREEVEQLIASGKHVYLFKGGVYDVNVDEVMHPGGRQVRAERRRRQPPPHPGPRNSGWQPLPRDRCAPKGVHGQGYVPRGLWACSPRCRSALCLSLLVGGWHAVSSRCCLACCGKASLARLPAPEMHLQYFVLDAAAGAPEREITGALLSALAAAPGLNRSAFRQPKRSCWTTTGAATSASFLSVLLCLPVQPRLLPRCPASQLLDDHRASAASGSLHQSAATFYLFHQFDYSVNHLQLLDDHRGEDISELFMGGGSAGHQHSKARMFLEAAC